METIRILLEKELLQAADRAARETRQSRSALIREALRAHLRRIDLLKKEICDRGGYIMQPQQLDEYLAWEDEAAWPPLRASR